MFAALLAHVPDLLQVFALLVTAFSIIARITRTPRDDSIAAMLVRLVDLLALNKDRRGRDR